MTENSLQRTVRRGIALLVIPLSLLVIQFAIHLRYRANLVDSTIVTVSQTVAYVLIAGATLSLLSSGLAELYSAAR